MKNGNDFFFSLKDLKVDKVLVYYDGPLLFVCKDDSDNFFLAYCCDLDLKEYVVAATSVDSLIELLENKKTMFATLQESSEKWKVKSDETTERVSDFDEIDLPEKNAYMSELSKPLGDYLSSLRQSKNVLFKCEKTNFYNIRGVNCFIYKTDPLIISERTLRSESNRFCIKKRSLNKTITEKNLCLA